MLTEMKILYINTCRNSLAYIASVFNANSPFYCVPKIKHYEIALIYLTDVVNNREVVISQVFFICLHFVGVPLCTKGVQFVENHYKIP